MTVTVSGSGAGPIGLTRAATIRTAVASSGCGRGSVPSSACPATSSVCHAWLWKARKIATHCDVPGKWKSRPPSCHTPSSRRNAALLP